MEADRMIPGGHAAKMLGVSRPTITRWIREGRLGGFVQAKTTRVSLRSLEQLLGRTVEPERDLATSTAA